MATFRLPYRNANGQKEKEFIFNTLLNNELLEMTDNGLYQVTEKGIKFLRYLDYIE